MLRLSAALGSRIASDSSSVNHFTIVQTVLGQPTSSRHRNRNLARPTASLHVKALENSYLTWQHQETIGCGPDS